VSKLLVSRRSLILAAPAVLLGARESVAQLGQLPNWPPKSVISGGGPFGPLSHSAAASTNTNNVNTTLNSTGANFIAAGVGIYNPGGAFTVTDSVGGNNNGAPSACTSLINAHGDLAQIFYWFNPTHVGASHVITVSGTGVYPTVFAAAFSGALTSPLDQQDGGGSVAVTSLACASPVTPGSTNQLVLSLLAAANVGTGFGANGGFTTMDTITGATGYEGGFAWLKQTTAASVNPTWSWTTSTSASTVLATFKFA
jgi:hypothetical protein